MLQLCQAQQDANKVRVLSQIFRGHLAISSIILALNRVVVQAAWGTRRAKPLLALLVCVVPVVAHYRINMRDRNLFFDAEDVDMRICQADSTFAIVEREWCPRQINQVCSISLKWDLAYVIKAMGLVPSRRRRLSTQRNFVSGVSPRASFLADSARRSAVCVSKPTVTCASSVSTCWKVQFTMER
jgi:hypothetical protein